MDHHKYTVIDELRQSTRFLKEPGTALAAIWRTPGEEVLAEIHDESLGGLGLILEDVADYAVGQEIMVAFEHNVVRGRVRHIEPQADGTFIVGLQCDRAS